ncbi:MAG: HEAT repeat domain-containing protein [Gammaproteobacteria bacterium]|nr:HEAT repeat domain-containing protein [Gammaproteobacteria bacterium]
MNHKVISLLLLGFLTIFCVTALAQENALRLAQTTLSTDSTEADELKIAALEALMTAPSGRAYPLVVKVLDGEHSDAVKSRALFVLGQIDTDEARQRLLAFATDGSGSLQREAIRMLGISGDRDALRQLGSLYREGSPEVRASVLNAYLIAGDARLVFDIAQNAGSEAEFNAAVQTLAAMDATDMLRQLQEKAGSSEGLMQAYAIAGDLESLLQIARSPNDPEARIRATRNIGIIGGDEAGSTLLDLYRESGSSDVREAALQGMLIHGHDEGVVTLYRESNDTSEKQRLLRTLIMMNSDLALELVDAALEGGAR